MNTLTTPKPDGTERLVHKIHPRRYFEAWCGYTASGDESDLYTFLWTYTTCEACKKAARRKGSRP